MALRHTPRVSQRSICIVLPAAAAFLSLLVLAIVGWYGWPGVVGSSGMEFCEHASGLVRQPANTYSNFGFILVGLAIGWSASVDSSGAQARWRRNRMRTTLFYPTLYALTATLLGPTSMALHASTTWWGGKIDVWSMFLWIAFVVAYALTRRRDGSVAHFLALYVPMIALLSLYLWLDYFPGTPVFGALIGVFALVELGNHRGLTATRAQPRWLAVAALAFAIAFGIWLPSRTGGPWCNPESLLQGHAAWHLLSAVAVGAVYLFFRSEQ